MRTTLDISSDVMEAARTRARREKTTIGKVISNLARGPYRTTAPDARVPKVTYGFRPFP